MQIIDCVGGDVVSRGLPVDAAMKRYVELGGRDKGYCLAEDDTELVKKSEPDEKGWLF